MKCPLYCLSLSWWVKHQIQICISFKFFQFLHQFIWYNYHNILLYFLFRSRFLVSYKVLLNRWNFTFLMLSSIVLLNWSKQGRLATLPYFLFDSSNFTAILLHLILKYKSHLSSCLYFHGMLLNRLKDQF